MRTAVRVIGWIVIVSFVIHAGFNVIRATVGDPFENESRGESAVDQRLEGNSIQRLREAEIALAENYKRRPLVSQLFGDFITISVGVVLVIVGRRKSDFRDVNKSSVVIDRLADPRDLNAANPGEEEKETPAS